MTQTKPKATMTHYLVESAIMLAIGTVLSELSFHGPWALGGSITFCSMLPLVLISIRYGTKRGLCTALVYSILQLVLGAANVQYATSVGMAVGIILLDYILPFTAIGFSGAFYRKTKNPRAGLAAGIVVTFLLRLLFHFISGTWIWEVLWPNVLGWAAPIWSIAYNGSYMIPEIIITTVVAVLLYATPLRRYFDGEDLK